MCNKIANASPPWSVPTGNSGVLIYRLPLDKSGTLRGHRVLVLNLCVSDCLRGVYLLLIGATDAGYRGVYVSTDTQWRHSVTCRVAGFLALVSSEVSASRHLPHHG